jgi:hypothetical protein
MGASGPHPAAAALELPHRCVGIKDGSPRNHLTRATMSDRPPPNSLKNTKVEEPQVPVVAVDHEDTGTEGPAAASCDGFRIKRSGENETSLSSPHFWTRNRSKSAPPLSYGGQHEMSSISLPSGIHPGPASPPAHRQAAIRCSGRWVPPITTPGRAGRRRGGHAAFVVFSDSKG